MTAQPLKSATNHDAAALAIDPRARRLSAAEKQQYRDLGYIKNLPVFAPEAITDLQAAALGLVDLLPQNVDVNRINMWHKANRWYYEICRTAAILDYVEDLIGGDFYQWGGQFFIKYPGDGSIVPWHQDAQYWPLTPRRTVSVWLAVFDADGDNGAMQIIPASHHDGDLAHRINDDPDFVLEQEIAPETRDLSNPVTLSLQAGEISLHDDGLIHGSGKNQSKRMRCGLVMRFCPTEVKADLSVWPTFEASMARGQDRFNHNPSAKAPAGNGFPIRKFQASAEFP